MFRILVFLCLAGCATMRADTDELSYMHAGDFDIAFTQRITDTTAPIHIYIEGDGHAFNGHGLPTRDPTPRNMFMRHMAARDASPNVAYIARPCQFAMSPTCSVTDWTSGRFSARVIDAMADAVRTIAKNHPVILVGYSGGAMISGLIIERNPDIDVKKWITVAGVLNHAAWIEYFGDTPLSGSLSMDALPCVPMRHYVAARDTVVPKEITMAIAPAETVTIVPGATHNNFPNLELDFSI